MKEKQKPLREEIETLKKSIEEKNERIKQLEERNSDIKYMGLFLIWIVLMALLVYGVNGMIDGREADILDDYENETFTQSHHYKTLTQTYRLMIWFMLACIITFLYIYMAVHLL